MKAADSYCNSALDALEPYLEGDLPPRQLRKLEGHLADCEDCRQELALARKVLEGLRSLPELPCPPGVGGELFSPDAAVAGIETDRLRTPQTASPARWSWLAAAVLLLAVAGTAFWLRAPAQNEAELELAQARRDVQVAMTVLESIHRKAAVSLRDKVLRAQVMGAPARAVNRMVLQGPVSVESPLGLERQGEGET